MFRAVCSFACRVLRPCARRAPALSAPVRDVRPCLLVSRAFEVVEARDCVRVGPGGVRVAPWCRRPACFTGGLGQVAVRGMGWLYVRRDGRAALVETFDNGPDPFAEGLARSRVGGKVAFVDRRLRPRIVTDYDWASPFEHGRADVCTECRAVADGEHSVMEGGRWGVIDRQGRVVVPVTLERRGVAVEGLARRRGCGRPGCCRGSGRCGRP